MSSIVHIRLDKGCGHHPRSSASLRSFVRRRSRDDDDDDDEEEQKESDDVCTRPSSS